LRPRMIHSWTHNDSMFRRRLFLRVTLPLIRGGPFPCEGAQTTDQREPREFRNGARSSARSGFTVLMGHAPGSVQRILLPEFRATVDDGCRRVVDAPKPPPRRRLIRG
jgi:hypothetical protein